MTIIFGLALDDPAHPLTGQTSGNVLYLGPHGLLQVLETHLGLSAPPRDIDYLRIEQYRQALRHYLDDQPQAFFAASFAADQFATAAELLARRDELLLAGWDFSAAPAIPPRLACLAAIEAAVSSSLAPGYADRYVSVAGRLRPDRPPLTQLHLCEPWELLPAHLVRLFRHWEKTGVPIVFLQDHPTGEINDLGRFQAALLDREGKRQRAALAGDGSLLLLRGKRETDLAAFLATLLRRNPAFQPACLIADKNRALDNALVQEGLPSQGIPSASLARPTLQVLKLVPVFLWHPVDPFKVLEFVSLSVKPLDDELANRIAIQMAQTPGLQGEGWQRTIGAFFARLEERAQRDPGLDVDAVRRQYRFWFERRRYDSAHTAPKEDVIGLYAYLERWARDSYEADNGKNSSLLVLLEQARRIRELLEVLPETQLSHLDLERIVRTVYEPAPVEVHRQEKGRLPFVFQPHALIGPVDELIWWNFIQREPAYFFSRWYQTERTYLESRGIRLTGPADENARLTWQRRRPFLQTQDRLLLVMPDFVDGQAVAPHPLLGDLEAYFGDLSPISYYIDRQAGAEIWHHVFDLPDHREIPMRRLGRPAPFLTLRDGRQLDQRVEETISSLQSLFYYPYQWVFRYKLLLHKSSILSIVADHTLMGNLAHRFFERLLQEDIRHWQRPDVFQWIDRQAADLFEREGAVLLLYGREPDRISFLKQLKFAAWSLIDLIQRNGWTVEATEHPLQGHFLGLPINGRADIVLRRGDELAVIDLKWRGSSYRERMIRNEEDLQLVLYAKLLTADQRWAHSAYFILNRGRLLARNNLAFREITPITPEADHIEVNQRILDRMQATYRWRMKQISRGRIEVRCTFTCADLENTYREELIDLLEMKQEDAPFDDYRTLIYLVE